MKLSELVKLFDHGTNIELHDGFSGRVVASTPNSIKKFGNVEVLGCHPIMKASSNGCLVSVFMFVWGSHNDIVRERSDEQED